jgi:hypothetical protein
MKKDPGQVEGKIPAGGIKFSPELVLVRLKAGMSGRRTFTQLLKAFSDTCIPLPFLMQDMSDDGWSCTFCVDSADWPSCRSYIDSAPSLSENLEVFFPAGIITIFPHRNSLHILGRIISVFKDESAPLYGFCTSISATAFCTDFLLLDSITDAILEYVTLPENHAPFKPEFILKQPR